MKYGYIYKISYNGLDYYGSSVDKYRFLSHKNSYNRCKKGNKHFYTTSFQLFQEAEKNEEEPNFEVIGCFYKYFCNECIRKEEQLYIDKYPCINKYNAYTNQKEWYDANKEYIREQQKIYYDRNKEKVAEQQKIYRNRNKEKTKEYRNRNKEKMKEYQKKYREAHKD